MAHTPVRSYLPEAIGFGIGFGLTLYAIFMLIGWLRSRGL